MDDARKLGVVLVLIGIGVGIVGQILNADAHMTAQTIISWVITGVGGIVAVSGGWMLSQSESEPG